MASISEEQARKGREEEQARKGREEERQLPPHKGSRGGKSRDHITSFEARIARLELAMADSRDRVEQMEQTLEEYVAKVDDLLENCQGKIDAAVESSLEKLDTANTEMNKDSLEFQAKMLEAFAEIKDEVKATKAAMEESRADWAMCKAAFKGKDVISTSFTSFNLREGTRPSDLPKPNRYDGSRDATIIDNFLWHMENYLGALNLTESAKVHTATLHLSGLAALWWRRKLEETKQGLCTIDTWEALKTELKEEFYPIDIDREARKKMKGLRHDRSIKDYVTTFSNLMLQIKDMSAKDLLFNFMDGLKPWAAQELKRHKVEDISTALKVASSL